MVEAYLLQPDAQESRYC